MKNYTDNFKRYEKKYLLKEEQYRPLCVKLHNYLKADEYGKSTICNIYYDTPDSLLIRRSMEKPTYKEKLRLRSYGIPNLETTVFMELKKKYKGIVYKRRIELELEKVAGCLRGQSNNKGQIEREIEYFVSYYNNIAPAIFISYERTAFYGADDSDLRITFDSNILWRKIDLSLDKGVYGNSLLQQGEMLLEIKIADAMPIWLSKMLDENKIYPTAFSKYGESYKAHLNSDKGVGHCV